jgi:hypothetical protein
VDAAAGFGVPDAGAFLDRIHRRQGLDAQFRIDPSAREIVEDMDLMTGIGEMERGWPTDESVATHYRYFHEIFPSAPNR